MTVNGKKALVTGGSRGIGFEICKILLENGCEVIALSKNIENLTKAKSLLPDLLVFQADVQVSSQFEKISEYVSNTWGYLDILINNAEIGGDLHIFEPAEPKKWEEVLRVNTIAPFRIAWSLHSKLEKGTHTQL